MADVVWFTGDQFFYDNGDPLNAGTIEFYDASSTNPRTVYKDSAEGTSWGTSLTLDSAGKLTSGVFVPTGAWKFIRWNAAHSQSWTQDNIPGAVPAVNATFAQPELPILTKATNYTTVAGDLGKKINVDASGGDVTITLVSAVTATDGGYLVIQNVGATGTVTVATSGGQTINGSTSIKLRAKDDAVDLVADGANWTGAVSAEIRTVLAKTADYTITQADFGRTVTFDATGGARTATLLAAATAGSGFWFKVQKIDSSVNAVIVDGNLAETIDGAATFSLIAQWQVMTVESDGTNWLITDLPTKFATEAEAAARTSTTVAVSPFSAALSPGALFGFTLSNNVGDATNDIDIAVGKARDSTDLSNILITSAFTKRLDANWAVGTAQGFRNSAAAITDTTYHVYAVSKALGAAPDYYAHTSTTVATVITALQAETGGSAYIYARRIGSILREGGVIVGFSQVGDRFLRNVPTVDINSNDPGTAAVTAAVKIPLGIFAEALVEISLLVLSAQNGSVFVLATSPSQTDTAPTGTLFDLACVVSSSGQAAYNSARFSIRTDSLSRVRYRASATSVSITVLATTHGWTDTRGKDA